MMLCDFGFASKGMLKIGEVEPGVTPESVKLAIDSSDKPKPSVTKSTRTSLFSFFADGWELMFNLRGIGWEFGTGGGLYVPKDWRNTESRTKWAIQSIPYMLAVYFSVDILDETLRCFPGLWDPSRSIWSYGNSPLENYAIGLLLHCMYGTFVVTREHTAVFPSLWRPLTLMRLT